jgi:hypothetical protein
MYGFSVYVSSANLSQISIKGSTIELVNGGVSEFRDLQIEGVIGGNGSLLFKLPLFSSGSLEVDDESALSLHFRFCVPGEVTEEPTDAGLDPFSVCQLCQYGTYSLVPTNVQCDVCPSNCGCPGGAVLDLHANYWRSSMQSDEIYQCTVPNACIGGVNVSTQCNEGASGPYCSVCVPGYTSNLLGQCYSCNDVESQLFEVIIFSLMGFLIILAAVVFVCRERILKR